MQKQFTEDELRLIRQKILALYLSLKETKNNCHLEKCTIGELVELKWRGSSDASGNPALSSAIENYINQENILVFND